MSTSQQDYPRPDPGRAYTRPADQATQVTVPRQVPEPPQVYPAGLAVRQQGTDLRAVHQAVNRTLATLALVLSIFVLAVLILWGFQVRSAIHSVGDTFGGAGSVEEMELPVYPEGELNYDGSLPDECWNPGGGEVCAPGGADGLPGGE